MGSNVPQNNNQIAGAITYYASSSDAPAQPVPIQPRQPRNLQGLLRFAMEATKAEDAPGNSELGPMDEERRRFLEAALKSLTIDMAQVIHDALQVLTNIERMKSIKRDEPLPEDVALAFNNLMDIIDDIDIANDFYKMGGFAVFPICFGSENEEIRARACSVLGELCQNNPFCQARALDCGLLNLVINLVQSEQGNALAKSIYALSCATREFMPACRELTAQGGCDVLAQLLANPEPAARTKAAFLIRYLCQNYRDAKEQFIALNVVQRAAEQIKRGRDETSEHMLSIIAVLVSTQSPIVMKQCKDPELGLQKILLTHLRHPDLVTDTFTEEKEYCTELLEKVFDMKPPIDLYDVEVADR